MRDTYPRSEKGYHVIYREFDDMGDRTYYPPSNDDSIAWATRLRNKNIAPSAEEAKLLKAFRRSPARWTAIIRRWRWSAEPGRSRAAEVVRVEG